MPNQDTRIDILYVLYYVNNKIKYGNIPDDIDSSSTQLVVLPVK